MGNVGNGEYIKDNIFLEARDLSFGYDEDRPLFHDVNMTVSGGEIVAVCGPSGYGKSTLCYCLSGIIPKVYEGFLSGKVFLYGEDIADLRLPQMVERLFMVFQEPSTQLFSPTIEDELCFAAENLCMERNDMDAKLLAALRRAGIEQYRYFSPNKLSGGQQQMVMMGASFVISPKLYIFDEALSQLDDDARKQMLSIMVELKEQGSAVLMIEHNRLNMRIADRVLELKKGVLTEISKESLYQED